MRFDFNGSPDLSTVAINPATGLPMTDDVESIDLAGNLFGFDFAEAFVWTTADSPADAMEVFATAEMGFSWE